MKVGKGEKGTDGEIRRKKLQREERRSEVEESERIHRERGRVFDEPRPPTSSHL